MSLQIWLPLNGNLNNQGLNEINTVTQSTAPTWVNGKIGKAMSIGGFYIPAAQAAKFYNNEEMSFCFWLYPVGASNSSHILGQSAMTAGDNRMFTIFQYPTPNDLHLSWQSNESGSTFFSSSDNGFFTANIWTHCAIVYNGNAGIIKIFKNGSLFKTYTCNKSTRTNFNYNVPVPNTSIRYLNDLRIYNHALSEKEVKEISKGLIIHYPLNNQYSLGKINKYNEPYSEGSTSSSRWTKTKLSNERGYNYKLTLTGDGTNNWPNCSFPVFTFTPGKRYYYSVKIRCNKWTNGNLYFRASRSSNDWGTNYVECCSSAKADKQWHEYVTNQVINSTYDKSGTTTTCTPLLEFYTSNMNGSGVIYDMDFDMKDVQVVESDNYIPFIRNDYAGNDVYDISGFNNHATTNGTLNVSSDTPKYEFGFYFPSGTGVFSHPSITLSQFTISFWGKHTQTNKMLMGSNASTSSTNTNWYWYGDNSFKYPLGEFYYSHNAGSSESMLNKWVHFVATYDGSYISVYRNGVYEGNKACTGDMILEYLSVGNGYSNTSYWENGYVSDFRLYTTVLSVDDIKELYQTSANICNNGTLMAYEFIE